MKECAIDFKQREMIEHNCLDCLVAEDYLQEYDGLLQFFSCSICGKEFFKIIGRERFYPCPEVVYLPPL